MAPSAAAMRDHIRILAENVDRKARKEVFSDGKTRRQRATISGHDWRVAQSEAELEQRAGILLQFAEVEKIRDTSVDGKNVIVDSAERMDRLSHELLKTIRASDVQCV